MALLTCIKRVREGALSVPKRIKQFVRNNGHTFDHTLSELYDVVNQEILEVRVRTNAARVAIWQFHNGETFSLSTPSFKLRSTFEQCREGIAPDKTAAADLPVSKCLDIMGPLIDTTKKVQGVTDVTPKSDTKKYAKDSVIRTLKVEYDTLNYSNFKFEMDANGIDRIYMMLLRAEDGRPMGVFCIQYMSHDLPEGMLNDKLYDVYPSVNRIQHALDKSH